MWCEKHYRGCARNPWEVSAILDQCLSMCQEVFLECQVNVAVAECVPGCAASARLRFDSVPGCVARELGQCSRVC